MHKLLIALFLLIAGFNPHLFSSSTLSHFAPRPHLLQALDCLPLTYSSCTQHHNPISLEEFTSTIQQAITQLQHTHVNTPWLSNNADKTSFFIGKKIFDADAQIELVGDRHGDIHSTVQLIKDLQATGDISPSSFHILNDKLRIIFLGDYTDRGQYGTEVMYLILQLYLHNPDQVFLIRGNHEEITLNKRYGFAGELMNKYFPKHNTLPQGFEALISQFYNLLPVALFVGCPNAAGTVDFIQLCHGGMDPSYDLQPILDDTTHQSAYAWLTNNPIEECMNRACKDYILPVHKRALLQETIRYNQFHACNNFQWGDFDFYNQSPNATISPSGRGSGILNFHQNYVNHLFEKYCHNNTVHGVIRAHQHDPQTITTILKEGNGLYCLWTENSTQMPPQWDGHNPLPVGEKSVWTLNVAPYTDSYENDLHQYSPNITFDYDTTVRLHLSSRFEDWLLAPQHHLVTISSIKQK